MKKKHSLATHGPRKDHYTIAGKGKVSMVQPVFLGPGWGTNMSNCVGMTDGMGTPNPPTP